VSISDGERSGHLTVGDLPRVGDVPVSTRLNRALFSSQRTPWLLLEMAAAVVFFQVGLRVSPYASRPAVVDLLFPLSVVYALAFGAISLGLGSHDREQRFDYLAIGRNLLIAGFLATLVDLAYHYFTLYTVVGRFTLVYGAATSLLGIFVLRSAITYVVRQHPYRFTVIGTSPPVHELLTGWIGGPTHDGMHVLVPWESIFPPGEPLTAQRLVEANIAEIVVALDALNEQEAIDVALVALRARVPVVDELAFYGRVFERLPVNDLSKRWILEQGLARPQALVVAAKRLADVAGAAAGLVVLAPLLVVIALAVRLSSPGPVVFVQLRQGRFLEPFKMYKFRTLRLNSDATAGSVRPNDDRVTAVGRALRRTHMDELPQLFNVLRGEMSLVGPRPEALDDARRMNAALPLYELRYLVRPGLTGHAQLMQGYAMDTVLDVQTKLSYDLYYLCNYSGRMDIRLLLRTLLFLTRGSR
jgi:lipopolysaccharide/colanic/teichoic acid biosynthesis glycosyltransferase